MPELHKAASEKEEWQVPQGASGLSLQPALGKSQPKLKHPTSSTKPEGLGPTLDGARPQEAPVKALLNSKLRETNPISASSHL